MKKDKATHLQNKRQGEVADILSVVGVGWFLLKDFLTETVH